MSKAHHQPAEHYTLFIKCRRYNELTMHVIVAQIPYK